METTNQAQGSATAAKKAAPAVQTITMTDKRVVEFPGARRLQKSVSVEGGAVTVRLDFVNGQTRTVKLKPDLVLKAAAHGLSQKLGDEISGVKDLDDAVQAEDELIARLDRGEWNETATGGGEGMAGASILMKALVEVTKKDATEVKAWLSSLNAKQKSAMREDPSVKPVVQRLEAEKAAKAPAKKAEDAVDTKSLLSGLLGGQKSAAVNSVFAQGDQAAKAAAPAQGNVAQLSASKDGAKPAPAAAKKV